MIERHKFQIHGDLRITDHHTELRERYGDTYYWPKIHHRQPIRKRFDSSAESCKLEMKTAKGKARDEKRRNKKKLKKQKQQEKKSKKKKGDEEREGQEQDEQNEQGVLGAQDERSEDEEAPDDGDSEIFTSCHLCPTDIIHRGTRTYAYRDFGLEGSVTSKVWQIQLLGRRFYFGDHKLGYNEYLRHYEQGGVVVYHRPGTIEAMYEGLSDVPATEGPKYAEVVDLP